MAESKFVALRIYCCLLSYRYEEYLDSQITGTDMYYLEDVELARHLVELGCAQMTWQRVCM